MDDQNSNQNSSYLNTSIPYVSHCQNNVMSVILWKDNSEFIKYEAPCEGESGGRCGGKSEAKWDSVGVCTNLLHGQPHTHTHTHNSHQSAGMDDIW